MRKDPGRLLELRRILLLDAAGQRAYDDVTRLLASSLEVPMTMVNLIEADRDWFKSSFGLQQTDSPAINSFCEAFFHTDDNLIVVEDTLKDPRFADSPLVLGWPFIRFYAAGRLVVRGHTVGTLCAYDANPRKLSAHQVDRLRVLASVAIELLDSSESTTAV